MTDATDRGGPALARIAAAFGLSRAAFARALSGEAVPPHLQAAAEASALQEAFARIADPRARQRCLAYVEAAARGEAADEAAG